MAEAKRRYAVVTGANKGIGLEICRQLGCTGDVLVVLTSRDERKGVEAVDKLHGEFSLSHHHLIAHQLDVMDPRSVASLADFVKARFGRLDILVISHESGFLDGSDSKEVMLKDNVQVNNAGIFGAIADAEALGASLSGQEGAKTNWWEKLTETYELAQECIQTNYYGAKRMVEALIPLLQLSDAPQIVNVSSSIGRLKNVKHEWAKQVLSDAENLSEERVDEVVAKFLEDFKEGEARWTANMAAYTVSKAAMNSYTRVLAKKYPDMCINCVCPGYVKTDLNFNTGFLTVQEGAESPVRLALMSGGGPSGLFFNRKEESSFD